jgi:hypothetical protein
MANDLVRTRNYIKKFMMMKANLQGVSVKMLTLQSQQAIGEAMLQVTIALRGMNMYGWGLDRFTSIITWNLSSITIPS